MESSGLLALVLFIGVVSARTLGESHIREILEVVQKEFPNMDVKIEFENPIPGTTTAPQDLKPKSLSVPLSQVIGAINVANAELKSLNKKMESLSEQLKMVAIRSAPAGDDEPIEGSGSDVEVHAKRSKKQRTH